MKMQVANLVKPGQSVAVASHMLHDQNFDTGLVAPVLVQCATVQKLEAVNGSRTVLAVSDPVLEAEVQLVDTGLATELAVAVADLVHEQGAVNGYCTGLAVVDHVEEMDS